MRKFAASKGGEGSWNDSKKLQVRGKNTDKLHQETHSVVELLQIESAEMASCASWETFQCKFVAFGVQRCAVC